MIDFFVYKNREDVQDNFHSESLTKFTRNGKVHKVYSNYCHHRCLITRENLLRLFVLIFVQKFKKKKTELEKHRSSSDAPSIEFQRFI